MFQKFIERPILSTVISIIIFILGLLGLFSLPVSQYPNIAPPTIRVSATYPGANADVVLKSVIIPLEEQINGATDMTYMTSSASNDGTASISVFFKVGRDPDMAAVDVQNRVARATSLLPKEVTQTGVSVAKRQTSMLLVFSIYSNNPAFDETFIQNYAAINILPQVQRVSGVGDASVFGSHTYSMRIWLKPEVMASYGLVPDDINNALNEQNIEAAPGKFGESGKQTFEYVLKYKGRLQTPEEFGNIVIRSNANGQILRLKDVARIELGALDYSSSTNTDGKPSISVAVFQAAGSNAQDVINNVKKVLNEASTSFPPGVKYETLQDTNEFLDASIHNVIETLIEAFLLVFLVVFIFLQDIRSTLIPAIAVPVAIVGTFFFLNLFGFTINLLTLFALILAIGIVVDDAIVVVEAVHVKLDAGAPTAKRATIDAMNEITGAIISITLVMSAVFLPVTFLSGTAGVFYRQFGITLAVAIIISAVNALTLSPALCVLFLKPGDKSSLKHKGFMKKFYGAFNTSFEALTQRYKKTLNFLVIKKWVALVILAFFAILLVVLMKTSSSGFVPEEDMGTIFADIQLQPGSSLERTKSVADQVDKIIGTIPEVKARTKMIGRGLISGTGSTYAGFIIKLKPWDERKGKKHNIQSIIATLFAKTAGINNARILFIAPPTLSGFSLSGGFSMELEDRTGNGVQALSAVSDRFLAALRKRPEIQKAITSFNPNFPQYQIDINVAKCKGAGVSVSSLLSTLQGYYGGVYASNFNEFGKQYRVMVQADAQYRTDPASLNGIYVRNDQGQMAPISEFITLTKVFGPEAISRFNMFTDISITGSPQKGYSTGDAINAVQEVAKEVLPSGYGYEFSGMTREEVAVGNQSLIVFILCFIFVYFLLAAQYESYIIPFAVILSLPVGLSGTFLFARIMGINNNIYLQISLIMLIGLLAKNAILIVQFALQRRHHGMSIRDAAINGALARLRPILMTSLAFIVGLSPLIFSSGAGANGNKSIGTGAIGGMLVGTVFGILIIPILFIIFQTLQEKVTKTSATTSQREQEQTIQEELEE